MQQHFNHCYDPNRNRRKIVSLTDTELKLVNAIREDKGFGPVFIINERLQLETEK